MATTELEAVNTILLALQSTPVNSLTGEQSADLSAAVTVLEEVRRAVCLEKWHFNSEEEKSFSRDTNNKIPVPSNVVRLDVSSGYNTDVDVAQRGDFLYDRKNHTFTFDSDLTCDVVYDLPWTDLPEAARRYIMIRATRTIVDRLVAEGLSHTFSQRDEDKALSTLKEYEGDMGDLSIFDGWAAARIVNRPSIINRIS